MAPCQGFELRLTGEDVAFICGNSAALPGSKQLSALQLLLS
jgi:hypothetical protein